MPLIPGLQADMKEKIRILQFICPTGFYGAERWILALANNSHADLMSHELAVTLESDDQDLEIVNQFKVGNTYKVPMKGRFDLKVVSKLAEIVRQNKIDIIHTHGYKSDIIGLLVAKKTNILSVSTPHGFGIPNDFKLKIFVRLGAFSLRFFDQVVPLSHQLMDEVRAYGVAEKKCTYIRNAVDLTEVDEFLRQKKQPDVVATDRKKQIGFIGQMIPRKNIKDAIDIFNQLWKKNEEAHNKQGIEFVLLGDGESRHELEQYARSLPSNKAIHFLGFRNDRLDILKDLDLFVMTSRDEGIPRCLMEACAMEIPIAAYNIPGIDQLVSHEQTGLLAPFGDKNLLAQYWDKLLNDVDYAQTLSRAARKFVMDKFSGQRMADEYYALFTQLLRNQHNIPN